MREFVADLTSHFLMAVMALIILAHFILIQSFGGVFLIHEPSSIGLAIEIVLMVLVAGLGIWQLVTHIGIRKEL